jgi:uncharacterized protein
MGKLRTRQGTTQLHCGFFVRSHEGNPVAQWRVGALYANGFAVPQNDFEAVKLYRRAADQNNRDAQNSLGFMYEYGRGVPKNLAEAAMWSRRAADQGHILAQNKLAQMYWFGHGVRQDFNIAVSWFSRAANQGDDLAQMRLGMAYEQGRGVIQDYVLAYMWMNLAASAPLPESDFLKGIASYNRNSAIETRDRIAGKMTAAQVAEAQKLAREWKPKPER